MNSNTETETTTEPACIVCESKYAFRWTDTHGIGACITCGAPYRLIHYDENKKREDGPPELLTRVEWLPWVRAYWEKNRRNAFPGYGNFPGSSYEVATKEDVEALNTWAETPEAQALEPQENADD